PLFHPFGPLPVGQLWAHPLGRLLLVFLTFLLLSPAFGLLALTLLFPVPVLLRSCPLFALFPPLPLPQHGYPLNRVIGAKSDGFVVVPDGLVAVRLGLPDHAAVMVSESVFRAEPDGLVEVLDRLVVVLLA